MLRSDLREALKAAMKGNDGRATATIRLILAALKDRDIAARGRRQADGISDDEILGMLQSMVRQRDESIALYEKGGREDLAAQEREEIVVIRRFLPTPFTEAETAAAVAAAVDELKAGSLKDMGAVMSLLRTRYPGHMNFARASAMVKDRLA